MKMSSFKERLKKTKWKSILWQMLWNTIGLFFLISGIIDFFFLKRTVGIFAIEVGLIILVINWMKRNQVWIFKPESKAN